MTKYLIFGVVGLAVLAAWVWSRRHRLVRQQPVQSTVIEGKTSTGEVRTEESTFETGHSGPDMTTTLIVGDASTKGLTNGLNPDQREQGASTCETEHIAASKTDPSASCLSDAPPLGPPELPNSVGSASVAEPEPSPSVNLGETQLAWVEQKSIQPSQRSDAKKLDLANSEREKQAVLVVNSTIAGSRTVGEGCQAVNVEDNSSPAPILPIVPAEGGNGNPPVPLSVSLETKDVASKVTDEARPAIAPARKPRDYRPLAPVSPITPTPPGRTNTIRQPRSPPLELKLQIDFGRDGGIKTLALVPERREPMPSQIEIAGLSVNEWNENYYDPVPVDNLGACLERNVEFQGHGGAQCWRWLLSRRDLHVLVSGDVCGLYQFGSVPRLLLDANHTILATAALRKEVESALATAGCLNFTVFGDATRGVPTGWLVFRDVKPTCAVAVGEAHILNALCPLPDIEPRYLGGICLNRKTWLAGFAPRIRFRGQSNDDFSVKIDGQSAGRADDGAYEAPGWDAPGEHRLWFAGKTDTYELRTMEENWERWRAHGFGTGAGICGAGVQWTASARWRRVSVPVANPLLIGARPGEVFRCRVGNEVNTEMVLALVPFAPVWALPENRRHQKRRSGRVVLLEFIEPIHGRDSSCRLKNNSILKQWVFGIKNARRSQLALTVESEDIKALWHRYGGVARQLRRQMR